MPAPEAQPADKIPEYPPAGDSFHPQLINTADKPPLAPRPKIKLPDNDEFKFYEGRDITRTRETRVARVLRRLRGVLPQKKSPPIRLEEVRNSQPQEDTNSSGGRDTSDDTTLQQRPQKNIWAWTPEGAAAAHQKARQNAKSRRQSDELAAKRMEAADKKARLETAWVKEIGTSRDTEAQRLRLASDLSREPKVLRTVARGAAATAAAVGMVAPAAAASHAAPANNEIAPQHTGQAFGGALSSAERLGGQVGRAAAEAAEAQSADIGQATGEALGRAAPTEPAKTAHKAA